MNRRSFIPSADAMSPVAPKNASKLIASRLFVSTLAFVAMLGLGGCSQNPYLAGGSVWQPNNPNPGLAGMGPANVGAIQAQIAELNRRVQLLDDNNRQLTTQLAQSEQQSQVYRDELNLVRRQLADTTTQYEAARIAAQDAQSQAKSFQASTQLRGGATIRANTNLSQMATRLNLPGMLVEPDGEVLRIVMPSDQLFAPGTPQLQAQAAGILDPVAAQIRSAFPRQRIGVESYTDNGQLYGGATGGAHQLTSAQSAAIVDMLTRRSGLPPNQLFMVAHGSNNPRYDNNDPAGRAANRRIELVIYPESF